MSRTRNSIARETVALLGVRPFTAHRSRTVRAANARLVAITGLALLVLLWRVHYFSSLLLIPLLAVKLAGTGWRAARFYLGDSGFREDGPPHPMGLTAPILVLSTVVLFLSGVEMLLGADRFGPWSTIHNGAAIVVTGALGLHLLAHLWDTPTEVAADLAPRAQVPGSRRRVVVTVVAFLVGVTLATAAMPISQWQSSRPPSAHHRDG